MCLTQGIADFSHKHHRGALLTRLLLTAQLLPCVLMAVLLPQMGRVLLTPLLAAAHMYDKLL